MKNETISTLLMRLSASALIVLGGFACTHEQEPPFSASDQRAPVAEEAFTPQRTEAQAKQIALAFLREQGGALRALSSSTAFETSVMTRSTARSLDAKALDSVADPVDTLLYVLNLRNQQGSVLVSGDKRLPDIVGYLPQGHLDLKNLPEHSGISLFIDAYPKYYGVKMTSMGSPRPLNNPPGHEPWRYPAPGRTKPKEYENWEDRVSEGKWEDVVSPLCPVTWDQGKPYNFRAPFTDPHQQALAGCVSVATAQLVASHRYPESIEGSKYAKLDWGLLCKYPTPYKIQRIPDSIHSWLDSATRERLEIEEVTRKAIDYVDQVSHLLNFIGHRLKNQWGTDGTGAYTWDIPGVLRALGYTRSSELTNFSPSDIVKSLDEGSSVIMSGVNTASTKKVGHAWLCDGYKKRIVVIQKGYDVYELDDEYDPPRRGGGRARSFLRKVKTELVRKEEFLFHYNWGWGGVCDGYFLSGVFSPYASRNFSASVGNILHVKP